MPSDAPEAREVRSRRERPAKPALSREWIVAETIRIMRAEGLEKATMRRVAQALDTGQSSLYVYVANTAELHAAVLDEVLAPVVQPPTGQRSGRRRTARWQPDLEQVLMAYRDVLMTHHGLARSALLLRPHGPNAVRLYDRVLGLLLAGGVETTRAAWGVDLLLQHVTATAAEHSAPAAADVDAPADPQGEWDALTRALHSADPEQAPHIGEHAQAVLAGTPEQRWRWQLRALVAGITGSPEPLPR